MRGGLSGIEPDYTIGLSRSHQFSTLASQVSSLEEPMLKETGVFARCSIRCDCYAFDAAFDVLESVFDAASDVLADGGSMSTVFVSTSWSSWPCSRVARYLYLASQKSHDPSPHHTHTSQLLLTVGMCRPSLTIGMCRPSLMRVIKPQGGWGAR